MSIHEGKGLPGRTPWLALALAAAALGASGCTESSAAKAGAAVQPATVQTVAGKNVKSVTLTEQAAKRVGVEMVAITAVPPGGSTTTVPYAAVIYTPDGKTWVYTETGSLTYVREPVVVANVGGDQGTVATLSAGPPVGTRIVKTGVMELYGAELGVGT